MHLECIAVILVLLREHSAASGPSDLKYWKSWMNMHV